MIRNSTSKEGKEAFLEILEDGTARMFHLFFLLHTGPEFRGICHSRKP